MRFDRKLFIEGYKAGYIKAKKKLIKEAANKSLPHEQRKQIWKQLRAKYEESHRHYNDDEFLDYACKELASYLYAGLENYKYIAFAPNNTISVVAANSIFNLLGTIASVQFVTGMDLTGDPIYYVGEYGQDNTNSHNAATVYVNQNGNLKYIGELVTDRWSDENYENKHYLQICKKNKKKPVKNDGNEIISIGIRSTKKENPKPKKLVEDKYLKDFAYGEHFEPMLERTYKDTTYSHYFKDIGGKNLELFKDGDTVWLVTNYTGFKNKMKYFGRSIKQWSHGANM